MSTINRRSQRYVCSLLLNELALGGELRGVVYRVGFVQIAAVAAPRAPGRGFGVRSAQRGVQSAPAPRVVAAVGGNHLFKKVNGRTK